MPRHKLLALPLSLLLALSAAACGGDEAPPSPSDAGTTAADAGTTTPDAGTTTPDAGMTTPDAGMTTPDSGMTTPDAGTTTPDAGTTTPDAGTTTPDAGAPPACGNGTVEGAEECDDGNLVSDDGCSSACRTERCGDGVVQAREQCEGADLDGASCLTLGFVGGTLSCGASCAFETALCIGPGCGNGVLEPTEDCDDGNTANDDGCSALCGIERCGDGITQANEGCDDGNQDDGDACRNDCSLPLCGDLLVSTGEQCDDGNTVGGDGCSADCRSNEACGNGVADANEQCDDGNLVDGDGCSATCATEICGDGVLQGGEQCDDGNQTNGDCCSAGCQVEAGCEVEVNDDVASANVFSTTALSDVVWGAISPLGDSDFFQLTVPAGAVGSIVAETQDAWDGTTCASNAIDSYIAIYDAAGTLLAENDDTSLNYCSRATADGLLAGDYYIEVAASAFAASGSFAYDLHATLTLSVCGNGVVEGSEACDDGNVLDGDGCSAACENEAAPGELEPNDSAATANPVNPGTVVPGAIDPAGDRDYYAFSVPSYADVRIETFDASGLACAGVDTYLTLYAPDGTTILVSDDDDGLSFCSLIDGTTDAGARHLAPGTYFAMVRAFSSGTVIPGYNIAISFTATCGNGAVEGSEQCDGTPGCGADCRRIPTCGDGFVDGLEQCDDSNLIDGDGCSALCQREQSCGNGFIEGTETCDDGNTAAGDGCDASCAAEPGHFYEVGANDDTATANDVGTDSVVVHGAISPVGDQDYYSVTLTGVSDLRLETFDADPARLTCAGIDTVIYFYDHGGAQLATDDEGGISSCSRLDLSRVAPGTYYVRVEDWLSNGLIPAYQLAVTIVSVCGDGAIAGTETCDDGNTVDDATCNSDCTLPRCGDNRLGNSPGELCDDGNTTDADGCDANCTPTGCGNGVRTGAEQCDDGNLVNGDGCDAGCLLEEPCGNGVLDAGEQCDDGNTIDGDGCSFATTPRCQVEAGHFYELEPNDDGTPSSGLDLDVGRANGPFSGTVLVHAAISPSGDDDVFAVTNPTGAPMAVRLDTYNAAAGYGVGVACGSSIDTNMFVYDATATQVANNDDRTGGPLDYCSGLDYTLAAGATVYVRVIRYSDSGTITGYFLRISIPVCGNGVVEVGEECEPAGTASCDASCQRVPTCGDAFVDAPELCDDGNLLDGDGCDATCSPEGVEAELEPNDSTAAADASTLQIDRSIRIAGSLTVGSDLVDYYRVNAAGPEVVRFEVFDNAAGNSCGTTTTVLRLYDAAGTQIVSDTTSGINSCSALVFPLPAAGTYYVRVEESGQNASVANYILEARFITPAGAEVEPNDARTTPNVLAGNHVYLSGDHSVGADADWYEITLATPGSIRAEVIEGDRAVETCEALDIDSRLTLYDAAGAQLVDDDDDGRGFCSLIDGTGATGRDAGAHNRPAGTYYLQVRASSFAGSGTAGQFVYRLVLDTRTP